MDSTPLHPFTFLRGENGAGLSPHLTLPTRSRDLSLIYFSPSLMEVTSLPIWPLGLQVNVPSPRARSQAGVLTWGDPVVSYLGELMHPPRLDPLS